MGTEQQVIVVGAGPTGLLNALGLAQQGIAVTVVERAASIPDAPRAMVYHWSTLDGLDRLGVLDAAVEAGFVKQDYAYRVRRTGEEIRFGLAALEGKVKRPYNLHLGQSALAGVILRELERHEHARVLWGHEVTAVEQDTTGVAISVCSGGGDSVLRASWAIGADGAGSKVRSELGLEFEGLTWPERFVATNVRFPDDRAGWAQSTFYVDDVLGAIIAKIDESGEHGLWRYTYMEQGEVSEEEVTARLPGFLAQVFGEDVARATRCEARSLYVMHQRSASSYRAGRVLLAGDAAHATNPSGGLGLTMGLFDSYVLNEALGAVVLGDADERVLDVYAEERRTTFVEKASPRASANKKLIFHSSDPEQLDRDLEVFRRMSRDREFAAERLYFTKTLESPSLLAR